MPSLMLTALLLAAQVVPARPGSSVIAGKIVEATGGGSGLSGVIVTIAPAPRAPGEAIARFSPQSVLVDAEGNFVFTGVPQGRYSIRAERRGFAEGAYGRRRPDGQASTLSVPEGGGVANVSIEMWKYGAIEGAVTDESGEPASGVTVYALRRRVVAGHAQFQMQSTAPTDDRGVYRLRLLPPGEYAVCLGTRSAIPTDAGRAILPVCSPLDVEFALRRRRRFAERH